MKKVIIFVIILINISSIYFWNFPYISKTDLMTYRLTDKALKRQTEIIGTGVSVNVNAINRFIQRDSIFVDYLNQAEKVQEIGKSTYSELQQMRDFNAVPIILIHV